MLEGSYLWQLFTVQQELEGRFFRYVAGVLAQRLRMREKVHFCSLTMFVTRLNTFPLPLLY